MLHLGFQIKNRQGAEHFTGEQADRFMPGELQYRSWCGRRRQDNKKKTTGPITIKPPLS